MSTLIVEGTLVEVRDKLEKVKEVIEDRKTSGYQLYHSSERWLYISARDGRMCPICESNDDMVFGGDTVKSFFPNVVYLGSFVSHPRTHDNPGFPTWIKRRKGAGVKFGCGCRLFLQNPLEAFEEQLHADKEAVI